MSSAKDTASTAAEEKAATHSPKDQPDGVESRPIRPIHAQHLPFWITLTLLVGWLCYLAYLSFG